MQMLRKDANGVVAMICYFLLVPKSNVNDSPFFPKICTTYEMLIDKLQLMGNQAEISFSVF